MTKALWRGLALVALATAALAGCSRDSAGVSKAGGGGAIVKAGLGAVLPGRAAKSAAPAAPADPAALAQAALASVKGPVMLATFESSGATTVLGQIEANGAMRSYQTPDQRGVILRDGLVVATRGFGRDLMSAETDAVGALIRTATAGQADRVQRYLDGAGVERPLPLRCTVTPGATASQTVAGIAYSGRTVTETCQSGSLRIDNGYLVGAGGRILIGRQWIGPGLGYLVTQVLRD